jgi:hypothetical protein
MDLESFFQIYHVQKQHLHYEYEKLIQTCYLFTRINDSVDDHPMAINVPRDFVHYKIISNKKEIHTSNVDISFPDEV